MFPFVHLTSTFNQYFSCVIERSCSLGRNLSLTSQFRSICVAEGGMFLALWECAIVQCVWIHLFSRDATGQVGPRQPYFYIDHTKVDTHKHNTHTFGGRTPLNVWSASRWSLSTCTTNNKHKGRTSVLSAELERPFPVVMQLLTPHGHWDRLRCVIIWTKFYGHVSVYCKITTLRQIKATGKGGIPICHYMLLMWPSRSKFSSNFIHVNKPLPRVKTQLQLIIITNNNYYYLLG
jgi:hypothetical protein